MATKVTPKSGDLKTLREQVIGPIKVFLETGRRSEEDDSMVMEEYEDKDGEIRYRPELEEEPFLKEVWIRKVYATKKNGEIEKKIREEESKKPEEDSMLGLRLAQASLVAMVSRWDLTDDGKPVPLTLEGLEAAEIPIEFIYNVLNACYDYRRVPKVSSDKSPNTSSQEE